MYNGDALLRCRSLHSQWLQQAYLHGSWQTACIAGIRGHGCHQGYNSIVLQYRCHAAPLSMPCSPLPGLLGVLWCRWAMAAVAGILFTELIGVGQPWWTQPLQVCQALKQSRVQRQTCVLHP